MRVLACLALTVFTVGAGGCVYPRRATSLTAVSRDGAGSAISAPEHIWQLSVVGAQIAPQRRGALSWDGEGGLPDAYVRIYRDDQLIFESETIDDSLTPEWNAALPSNVRLPPTSAVRFEVWDRDTVGSDPIGIHRGRGLPATAIADADARILLDGGSYLTVRASAPRPHRGLGLAQYEVRPEALIVMRVLPFSPAGRAGIEAGDRIVKIGEQAVSAMTEAQAASALSMAVNRPTALTLQNARGEERTVELDHGFVWLTM